MREERLSVRYTLPLVSLGVHNHTSTRINQLIQNYTNFHHPQLPVASLTVSFTIRRESKMRYRIQHNFLNLLAVVGSESFEA